VRRFVPSVVALFVCVAETQLHAARPQQAADAASSPAAAHRTLLNKYCIACHSDRLKTGGLTLEKIDTANVPAGAETWEKVLRKLRAGAMPPQGMPRPDQASVDELVVSLQTSLDRAALAKPNPGRASVHRLNRTEYANAIRDLLALNVDATSLLPSDDENYGFDNIADVLKTSPALMERYLSASREISRLAVGDPLIAPDSQTYRVKPDLGQDRHLDGLPLGTRGGILIRHNFPLNGTYTIKIHLARNTSEAVRGLDYPNDGVILIDGVVMHQATIGGQADEDALDENTTEASAAVEARLGARIPVKAGERTVAVTFRQKTGAQVDGLMQPYLRSNVDPLEQRGVPLIDNITISGPFDATGPGDTASRHKIFVCRPVKGSDEVPCAKKILSTLARQAYRRPATETETELLLSFYQRGRNEGGSFDAGIERALRLILTNPKFLFRSEPDPANAAADSIYRINDLELASRLSFFLWSSIPDDQLLNLAGQGKLHQPAVLGQQVRRMLADPRSESLVTDFAGQWLYLRNLANAKPNVEEFPDFDDNLRQGFLHETELFFGSIIHEDRSVLDLLNANYTFVNERLARHYGMPNIYGSRFRRVAITDEARRGLLGQGSVLTVTSYATRTSPVARGKWILENILGTPPPPPPPNVPALKEKADGSHPTTLRQRMEEHRKNPACAVCHKVMDPLGFSLENFDAIGQWRTVDGGVPIDSSGQLADGTKVNGPVSLRQALMRHPENFVSTMTEKLMTYALGRGLEYYDMPAVRSVVRDAAKNNYRFSSLITGIVNSVPFQMKKAQPQESKGDESHTVASSARP
jgi:mono/diheme cytochrome c family protein